MPHETHDHHGKLLPCLFADERFSLKDNEAASRYTKLHSAIFGCGSAKGAQNCTGATLYAQGFEVITLLPLQHEMCNKGLHCSLSICGWPRGRVTDQDRYAMRRARIIRNQARQQ